MNNSPSIVPKAMSAVLSRWVWLGLAAVASAMPLNSPLLDTYDYIIVGGGASGLTVGYRLSEDPAVNVLILEAGIADNYPETVMVPVMQGSAGTNGFSWCGQLNWCDVSAPQTFLDNSTRNIPQGRGLGGGTLINAMLWNRGDQGDWDDWVTLGNAGWGWSDMLPYFKKSETFHPEDNQADASFFGIGEDTDVHGFDGPQPVSFPNWYYNSSQIFFAALNSLGVPTVPDPNTGLEKGGMYLPMGVNATNQTRADARRQKYDTVAGRQNLYVSTSQHVTRVLFEGGCNIPDGNQRAVGVEYSANPGEPKYTVAARREVILAAGALRTPQTLELSGIGSASAIAVGGLAQRINLPGVGNGLQDHMLLHTLNFFNNQSFIYSNFLNNQTNNDVARQEYYANRTGPWTSGSPNGNAFLALGQFSNRSADLQSMANAQTDDQYLAAGLDQTVIDGYGKMRKVLADSLTNSQRAAIEILQDNAGGFQLSLMRPFGRGSVHINSSDAFVYPILDMRYGSNPVDMEIMVDALGFKHQIFTSAPFQELQPLEWSPASFATRDDYITFINQNAATEFHVSGSATMMPKELGGVVDTNLLVYGTSNLRIVDASIFPITPAAHLEAVVYGVSEKAADIIKAAASATPAIDPSLPLDASVCSASSYASRFAIKQLKERQAAAAAAAGQAVSRPTTPTAEPTPTASYVFGLPLADANRQPTLAASVLDEYASVGQPKGAGLLWAVTNNLLGVLGDVVGGILARR